MIFAAIAAIVLVSALVTASMLRARRPPLRTGREEQLAELEDPLDAVPSRPFSSPIDRMAPIHDLDPIENDRSGIAIRAGQARVEELPWQDIDARSNESGAVKRTDR